ncbi:hypothetical protein MKW94_000645 [Papaver nudicaule]|uniref:Short-chain dehydrogenase/reductase n=1 Tax=Papaver nudicaule TaxID=74823 RepID=A0AA42B480_PAPNU|nr:hypothetical protein [Papaver nudicaule]
MSSADILSNTSETKIRCAVVTGGNKGIGFEICKQLASNGVLVVLTSRDIKKGLEAVENLISSTGVSEKYVVFHQLDVLNPLTISSLADFIKIRFRKLDILVNNAGVSGNFIDDVDRYVAMQQGIIGEKSKETADRLIEELEQQEMKELFKESYELAEQCLKTNYYGVKSVTEVLIPLLQLSDSPRIVNLSSMYGTIKNVSNEKSIEVLADVDQLTEERIDGVANSFLKDYKEDVLETNGWPDSSSAYKISKACVNAYTRILAKKFSTFCVNSVCPGWVATDFNYNIGIYTAEQGAKNAVTLALLPDNGRPSGQFFDRDVATGF